MQVHGRLPPPVPQDFDVLPWNGADADTQGLGDSLFGGEAPGKALRPATTSGDFSLREDAVSKAVPEAFEGVRDALDLDQVYASANFQSQRRPPSIT